jgi:hypothetical protein
MENNMKKIVLTASLVLGLSSFAAAQETLPPECLDKARVQKILKTFSWSSDQDDNGKLVGYVSQCDPKSPFYQAMKAWIMLEDFPLLYTQKDEFNYSVLGKSSSGYIRSRVNVFNFDRDDSIGCKREGVAAYVMNSRPTVHLCPHLKNFSTYFLIGVLVHESRHVDGYPHSDCTRGNMNGYAGACDNRYSDGGSYGVGTEFDVRVSRTEGIAPALRSEARAYALDSLLNRFNKLPLGLADGIFAQTDKRGLYFLGPDKITEVLKESPAGILVRRGLNPTWFDAEKAEAVSLNAYGEMGPTAGALAPTAGSIAESFRKTYSPELRKSLVDISYSGEYACQLFETEVKCESEKEEVVNALPGKSVGFVFYENYLGVNLENGDIYILPTKFAELKTTTIARWKMGRAADRYRYFVALDRSFGISLEADGRLRTTDGLKQKGKVVPDLDAYRFEKIVGPSIWSPKIKDL